jgi:hypothetical protein
MLRAVLLGDGNDERDGVDALIEERRIVPAKVSFVPIPLGNDLRISPSLKFEFPRGGQGVRGASLLHDRNGHI